MEFNSIVRDELFIAIEKQVKANDPPETAQTLKRLMGMGYSKFESKQLIAQCLFLEILEIFETGRKHDEKKYIGNLLNLPELPQDPDE